MRTLALVLIATICTPGFALAQQHSGSRNAGAGHETSRFPVLRKAFRQIRSDLRYHAGAVRETASFIRQDVKSTIRNGVSPSPREPSHYEYLENDYRENTDHKYGYRGEPVPPFGPRRYSPEPIPYDDLEPPRQPRRGAVREIPTSELPQPLEQPDPRTEPKPEREDQIEPMIVAPRTPPQPQTKKPAQNKETAPKPKLDPKPDTAKKPVLGKIDYPMAKQSDRAGFHYSPFAPYELLDTQDIEPGGLARDPGNDKIFRIPK